MVQRSPTIPLDHGPDDRLSFGDLTMLTLLGVGTVAVLVLLFLGMISAAHRIACLLGRA